ncbi:MAG: hypothetical protein JG782_1614 [Anaerophaga sp.]|uniref:hypothetical protein n=1 Tax=Anaerophaga thermohalophila TaxID=177400 RepID=UPI000237C252|nr:hypothetical protein [Anaerophaga thermohalophila]MBZ4676994.1 hypothetical protein [Anaerophaga sp.]MDI3521659.1 hypothetical protein [Anaerophaga sp.]MDK2842911.1 hypothetical protein [Anaerophaga sp.]MDN5291121.1 hypothetical protein [Anaerophaga sp.]
MKKTAFIFFVIISIGNMTNAQPHSGFKLSATFNDTKLKSDGEQKLIHFSEGSGWEFGYSLHSNN